MTGDPQINVLAQRAYVWLNAATPAELWDAVQKNDIDARCGMPDLVGIGALLGPGDFLEELHKREWADDAHGDLAKWFANSYEAQEAARHEISAQISEVYFDLGEWEWKEPTMENEDADPVGSPHARARRDTTASPSGPADARLPSIPRATSQS